MLMIRRANHHSIQAFHSEKILIMNELLRVVSRGLLYHRNCSLALLAPGVTHCCDFDVGVLTELQDLLEEVPCSATDHCNRNPIVRPKNPSRADSRDRCDCGLAQEFSPVQFRVPHFSIPQ